VAIVMRASGIQVEKKFPCNFKLILPVQSSPKKFSPSRFTQITSTSSAIPRSKEGRFAIVTDVECGMRWTRLVLLTRALDADGEVVWS
jgi:hypothetical protein